MGFTARSSLVDRISLTHLTITVGHDFPYLIDTRQVIKPSLSQLCGNNEHFIFNPNRTLITCRITKNGLFR
jgi:hypothetical protein